jgi:hypothetical protein
VRLAAVVFLLACGPRGETPTTDFGPPAQPIDPVTCAAARLERFAEAAELTIEISTEPVVDAGRIDKVPCKTGETDEQCIARARKRAAPAFYEVTGVTIGADNTQVDFTYVLDGRRVTEQAESMAKMVERLKALQAAGHKVTFLQGAEAPDAGPRHAAIAYRGIGGTERRIATLRWHPTRQDTDIPAARARAIGNIQALAEDQRIELRALDTSHPDALVVTATCGPG